MQIRQIRNATLALTLGERQILVDPMLCAAGSMPGFKLFGGGRRANPLVKLPEVTPSILPQITDLLVTHTHPDHFDPPGLKFARDRALPVWAPPLDLAHLQSKGLDARPLAGDALSGRVEVIPGRHGRGLMGYLMGPVHGVYIEHPDEPSLYLTGDAVPSKQLSAALQRLDPDIIVAPAGAANFGIGGDVLFSIDELVQLIRKTRARWLLNHLEALDHCPTTRSELRTRMQAEGLTQRIDIPEDGEVLQFVRTRQHCTVPRATALHRSPPRLQKWLTSHWSGI